MKRPESKRPERVAEQIRSELMDLILRGAIRDPRASGVLVSDVKVSGDLGLAHIYLRLAETPSQQDNARRSSEAVEAMSRASGFLRRELARRLRLRRMPELEFHWDEVVDEARRIEGLLSELRDDEEPGEEEG